MSRPPAVFALEDGSVFHGEGFGAECVVTGEAVFNTSMTGYQEILTDPSYFGQIVTMTAPQIGNYGINPEDPESAHPQARGFVIRELSPVASNWRSSESLSDYLARHGIPGITGVDTRSITKKLRTAGVMKSCLSVGSTTAEEAIEKARTWEGLVGFDFVREVTRPHSAKWNAANNDDKPFTSIGTHLTPERADRKKYHIAAIDFGAKKSIFKKLTHYGFEVTVFPASASLADIEAVNPDGIFLSNGPGDPSAVDYAHKTVSDMIDKYPVFGICFGHQVITHAIGGDTFKLKFGHRGGNQPVQNLETGQVIITAQNHGFATVPDSISDRAVVTQVNLNDRTVAGLRLKDKPVFSVQYHPEAGPGPNDALDQFEKFYQMVADYTSGQMASLS